MDRNALPYNKVVAGSVGVPVAAILVYLIEVTSKVDIPTGIETAIGLVMVFVLGYFVPERTEIGGQLLNRARKAKRQ
jgi:H+/Cl- antiporter ClcA